MFERNLPPHPPSDEGPRPPVVGPGFAMPFLGTGTITIEGSNGPPLQLWASPEGFRVRAQLPGLCAEDVELELHGGSLTLAGKFHSWEGGQPRAFRRRIHLPVRLDPTGAAAKVENGLLDLFIPLEAQLRKFRIPVQGDQRPHLRLPAAPEDRPRRTIDRFAQEPSRVAARTRALESEDEYRICVEIPGSRADDVRVQIEGDELNILARRSEWDAKGMTLVMGELAQGDWNTVLHIPDDVDIGALESEVVCGELRLRMPRQR